MKILANIPFFKRLSPNSVNEYCHTDLNLYKVYRRRITLSKMVLLVFISEKIISLLYFLKPNYVRLYIYLRI